MRAAHEQSVIYVYC